MAIIRDTDLLYVQRGDTPHNWTGLELKSLVSSAAKDGKLIIGNYLTPNGSEYDGSTTLTINVDGTSSSTPDKVVVRDADGDFAGNIISAVGGQFSNDVTVGGELTLSKDPVENLQAATKQYVDSLTGSSGFVFISDTPPPAPSSGDLWWNTGDGTLYVMYEEDDYNDGAGPGTRQWVVAVPTGGEGGSGGGGGAEVLIQEEPPFPDLYPPGTLWWDNSEESAQLYILYNNPPYGKVWVEITSSISTSDEYVLRTGDQMVGDLAMGEKVAQLSGIWKTSGDLLLGGDVFASEPNIYLHATDGSATFVGNVGIGTDSPDRSLHINSGIIDTVAKFESSDSSAIINFVDNGDANGVSVGSVNGNMTFRSGLSTERMRIDSSGNVGIGTTSPDHGKLTLFDSASAAFNALVIQQGNTGSTASDGLHIGIDSAVDAYITHKENRAIAFGTANTERVRIDSSGNVGIGTTSPPSLLSVHSSSTDATFFAGEFQSIANPSGLSNTYVKFEKGDGYGGAVGGFLEQGVGSGLKLAALNGGTLTDVITIRNTGNVGIGTTSPNHPLVISDNGETGLELNGRNEGPFIQSYNRSTSSYNQIDYFASLHRFFVNSSEAACIDSSGRVGIGTTSPTSLLHLESSTSGVVLNAVSTATSGESSLFITGKNSSGVSRTGIFKYDSADVFRIGTAQSVDIRFETNDLERMRILSSGGLTFNGDTAAANALDDYEEGTWTPAGANNFNGISGAAGAYVKVGKIVWVSYQFSYSGLDSTTEASAIQGLPFAPGDANPNSGVEATGVAFGTNKLLFTYAEVSSTIYFEMDRLLSGAESTGGDFLRGSLVYST